jgi:hypothetical protein
MTTKKSDEVAVFYAIGADMMEARLLQRAELPSVGAVIELKERSIHTRTSEHCTRPCCAVEPTRKFKVVNQTFYFNDKFDRTGATVPKAEHEPCPLQEVVDARPWVESLCLRHDWCRLFDVYTLLSYLRIESKQPAVAAIIDVEVADG